jgi:plastocyanin
MIPAINRRALLAALPFAFSFGAVALRTSAAAAADFAIKIDNFVFTPDMAEIPVGTTVVWTNEDDIPHTVADTTRTFKSKAMDTGDTYSFTFTKAGTYEYFCSLPPHMKATIVDT